jgi:hypothetical protein
MSFERRCVAQAGDRRDEPKSDGKPAREARAADARAERLAAELRENLKRRKAQARGRQSGQEPSA